MTMTLRPAEAAEQSLIYRIKSDALRVYAEEYWGPWDDRGERARFDSKFVVTNFEMVVVDDSIAGFLETQARAAGGLLLRNIALEPEYRNRGIGGQVVDALIRRSAGPIALTVLKNNPARRFYERCGFQVVGEPDSFRWLMLR